MYNENRGCNSNSIADKIVAITCELSIMCGAGLHADASAAKAMKKCYIKHKKVELLTHMTVTL